MNQLKVTRCVGEGQGSCKRCSDSGKWNRMWCCFLYKIEGYEGCYCADCVKEIHHNADTIEAIAEVEALKKDPHKKTYSSFAEIIAEASE